MNCIQFISLCIEERDGLVVELWTRSQQKKFRTPPAPKTVSVSYTLHKFQNKLLSNQEAVVTKMCLVVTVHNGGCYGTF